MYQDRSIVNTGKPRRSTPMMNIVEIEAGRDGSRWNIPTKGR